MNPNPQAKRILCFGDSNTWGRSGLSKMRYPADVRWTGLLQMALGSDFEVIEEGLPSRTTEVDDDDPDKPSRNGLTYLQACLESQNPLDMVILWLGSNDLKSKFERTPEQVGESVEKLLNVINMLGKATDGATPKILLISPPLIREECLKVGSTFIGAGGKSIQLAKIFQQLAEKLNCAFLDLAPHVPAGEADGVHLEPQAHRIVAEFIGNMLNDRG